MAERLHPGVYVEEVSSGVRPIEGVSTSTAAFIGEAARGIPDTPHFLTSFDEFTRLLGGYADGDKGLLAHAVEAFFNNGGQRAYAVRVLPNDATLASSLPVASRLKAAGTTHNLFPPALSFEAKGDGAWADALRVEIADSTHFPGEAFQIKVKWSEGATVKLLETFDDVRMDRDSEDYVGRVLEDGSHYIKVTDELKAATEAVTKTTWPLAEAAPLITIGDADSNDEYQVYANTKLLFQAWTGDNPSPSAAPKEVAFTQDAKLGIDALVTRLQTDLGTGFNVAKVIAGSRKWIEIRSNVEVHAYLMIPDATKLSGTTGTTAVFTWHDTADQSVSIPVAGNLSAAQVLTALQANTTLTGKFDVSPVGGSLVLKSKSSSGVTTVGAHDNANVVDYETTAFPGLAGSAISGSLDTAHLSVAEDRSHGVPSTLRSLGLGGGARARGYAEDSSANPAARPASTASNAPILLTGGSDGTGAVGVIDFTGSESARTGLHAFDPVEINLLAIPGKTSSDFVGAGMTYCDGRGDCFFLADGPGAAHGDFDMDAQEARSRIEGISQRSKNAAIYYPWVQITDPLGIGKSPTRFAPPSGFMAGIYARIDNNRGVWKAPAGIEATVSGALGLQVDLVDADQDRLNPVSLNCLRQFPSTGVVSWGARTLSNDSEWRYVSVRRMALFLKESLRRGMKWAVFEPNDEQLWDQIRANIKAFMLGLFRQGAFQGTTPDEAFRVKCDRSTNPQENVDAGIVTAQVAFAPLKPAEFVVIEISQKSLVS